MSQQAVTGGPWYNRWTQPSLDQLLSALKAHHRRPLDVLIDNLGEFDNVERNLMWYGPSWKWTIEYNVLDKRGKSMGTLCYLVPSLESPLVCIPLSDSVIAMLPMKRLSKLVRDGIKGAKCAVSIHWATWSPTNQSEVGHLADLIRRKHKLVAAPIPVPAK